MANFRTHISFGAILAIAAVVFMLIVSLTSNNIILLWVAAAVLVGSFLPDLDSDDGMPFQIVFGAFSLLCAGGAFYYLYQNGQRDWLWLIITPLLTFIFVRFGVGYVFKKFTHHRGMFHSIPAVLISTLGAYIILRGFNLVAIDRAAIALAVGLGYLGHLALDEIYATVNFRGLSIKPSRSLGSALKLFSGSGLANFISYGALIVLGLIVFI